MKKSVTRRVLLQSIGMMFLAAGCQGRSKLFTAETPITSARSSPEMPTTIPPTVLPTASTQPTLALKIWSDILPIEIESRIVAVATGFTHGLALTDTEEVWGWGRGSRLGLESERQVLPMQLEEVENIKQISAGVTQSLFVTTEGNIRYMDETSGTVIIVEDLPNVVKAVPYSQEVIIALTDDGDVWYRGPEGVSIFPFGDAIVGTGEFVKLSINNVVDVKAEVTATLFRRADGTLWFWGRIGDKVTDEIFYSPQPLNELEGVIDMAKGLGFVAVINNGQIWQKGAGYNGEIIEGIDNIVSIESDLSVSETYAISQDGQLWGWGTLSKEIYGDAPLSSPEYFPEPVSIDMPVPVEKLSLNSGHMLTLDIEGTVWTWNNALLGFNEDDNIDVPIEQLPIPILKSNI